MPIIINPDDKTLKKQVDRNLIGIELEKQGLMDHAITLYEMNVLEYFIGTHPYDRLMIIYYKRKQYKDEERVINKVIEVMKALINTPRIGIKKKLSRYELRLNKLQVKL